MLEPMSAYERRIIHSEVQGIEGVATNSIGSDNNRKIVIYVLKDAPAKEEATEEVFDAPVTEEVDTPTLAEAGDAVEDATV